MTRPTVDVLFPELAVRPGRPVLAGGRHDPRRSGAAGAAPRAGPGREPGGPARGGVPAAGDRRPGSRASGPGGWSRWPAARASSTAACSSRSIAGRPSWCAWAGRPWRPGSRPTCGRSRTAPRPPSGRPPRDRRGRPLRRAAPQRAGPGRRRPPAPARVRGRARPLAAHRGGGPGHARAGPHRRAPRPGRAGARDPRRAGPDHPGGRRRAGHRRRGRRLPAGADRGRGPARLRAGRRGHRQHLDRPGRHGRGHQRSLPGPDPGHPAGPVRGRGDRGRWLARRPLAAGPGPDAGRRGQARGAPHPGRLGPGLGGHRGRHGRDRGHLPADRGCPAPDPGRGRRHLRLADLGGASWPSSSTRWRASRRCAGPSPPASSSRWAGPTWTWAAWSWRP